MEETEDEKLFKNTIGEERFRLSNMVRKLGSKLSGLMITCGLLVFFFGVVLVIEPSEAVLSGRLGLIFTCALGFIGGLNILCGLLLLLGED